MPESRLGVLGPGGALLRQAMNRLVDHAFVLLDRSHCIQFWSAGAATLFGRSPADALGLHLDRVFGKENRCWDLPIDQSEECAVDVRVRKRCRFTRPDGSQCYLITAATALRDDSKCIGFALHALDLAAERAPFDASTETSRAVAERVSALSEQVRTMAARLEAETAKREEVDRSRVRQLRGIVAAQENERGRIARDLREHLGQQLTALQLTVEALEPSAADQPQRFEQIRKTLEMIAGIGRGLDAVAWELRPAALDEFGLSAVLRDYVQQWARQAGIRSSFHSGPHHTQRFLPEVEATLYRIARTALETAAQAGASSVDVRLDRRDANALLVVEDDTVVASERRDATGLAQMRERAAALGGSVEIEATSAGGFAILACVPLLRSS